MRAALPVLILPIIGMIGTPRAGGEGPRDPGRLARFALDHDGDPSRGRALFFDAEGAACARCHRAEGEGEEVGPDLSDVGAKLGRADLIEAVLEPSRQVVEGYRPTVIATADGRVLTGLVRAESADRLTLVDAEGREAVVRRAEVEGRIYGDASIMPEGLGDRLSASDFADLIAFLERLRSSGQPTPGSTVIGPIELPAGFEAERLAGGISGATALAVAPDGRVFLCEQPGTLRVFKGGDLLPTPFVALEVDSLWERGLIGVTLDPRFDENGYVYVCYVAAEPYPHHRIGRLRAEGDVAAPGGEVVLFEGDDQGGQGGKVPAGHQGGAIHFGPDGKLYVGLGEQTAGAPSQSLDSLLGKILRIGPDGSIPPDNPFYDSARGKARAIWALGLRNPFTFAFQPGTGRMFINDVGGRAEEVNEGIAGANYGWPAVEHGPTPDPGVVGPIHWYPTASIAGGAFCPAEPTEGGFPEDYRGRYFFMDFVKGWIQVLDPDDPRRPAVARPFASGLPRPVDLAFGPDGALYVLLRDAWVRDGNFRPRTGTLIRIRYAG